MSQLTQLKRKVEKVESFEWASEVAEMRLALNRAGMDASNEDIQWAWQSYSESMAATWMSTVSDEATVEELLYYLEPSNAP